LSAPRRRKHCAKYGTAALRAAQTCGVAIREEARRHLQSAPCRMQLNFLKLIYFLIPQFAVQYLS
jgi:hypothetical protein